MELSDDIALHELENSIKKKIWFIDDFKIVKNKSFCSTNYDATAFVNNGMITPKFKVSRKGLGLDFIAGHKVNINVLLLYFKYCYQKKISYGVNVTRPLIKYADFNEKGVFPYLSLNADHSKRNYSVVDKIQLIGQSADLMKKIKFGTEFVDGLDNVYYKTFVNGWIKNSFSFLNYHQKIFTEIFLIQEGKNIVPSILGKFHSVFRIFNNIYCNLNSGIVLSSKKIPESEFFEKYDFDTKKIIYLPNKRKESQKFKSFLNLSLENQIETNFDKNLKFNGFIKFEIKPNLSLSTGIGSVYEIFGKMFEARVVLSLIDTIETKFQITYCNSDE